MEHLPSAEGELQQLANLRDTSRQQHDCWIGHRGTEQDKLRKESSSPKGTHPKSYFNYAGHNDIVCDSLKHFRGAFFGTLIMLHLGKPHHTQTIIKLPATDASTSARPTCQNYRPWTWPTTKSTKTGLRIYLTLICRDSSI